MKFSRFVLFVGLSALLASGVAADETPGAETQTVKTVDPSGTWRWESQRNGETVKHQLKLVANDKNEVSATYYGMIDGLKSTRGAIDGDKLTLVFDVERDNYAFTAKYEATISGDRAVGTLSFESDQRSGEVPWEAHRSVELSDVVGTWELELRTPDGEVLEPVLIIQKKGDDFVGTWDGKEIGEFPVKDLKAEKATIAFTVTGELDGQPFVAKSVAKPMGNKLEGEMRVEINGETHELPFAGGMKTENQ